MPIFYSSNVIFYSSTPIFAFNYFSRLYILFFQHTFANDFEIKVIIINYNKK